MFASLLQGVIKDTHDQPGEVIHRERCGRPLSTGVLPGEVIHRERCGRPLSTGVLPP